MTDIVNLRHRRKQQARQVKAQKAAENRQRFGEAKAPRQQRQAETKLQQQRHDGHRLTAADDNPE